MISSGRKENISKFAHEKVENIKTCLEQNAELFQPPNFDKEIFNDFIKALSNLLQGIEKGSVENVSTLNTIFQILFPAMLNFFMKFNEEFAEQFNAGSFAALTNQNAQIFGIEKQIDGFIFDLQKEYSNSILSEIESDLNEQGDIATGLKNFLVKTIQSLITEGQNQNLFSLEDRLLLLSQGVAASQFELSKDKNFIQNYYLFQRHILNPFKKLLEAVKPHTDKTASFDKTRTVILERLKNFQTFFYKNVALDFAHKLCQIIMNYSKDEAKSDDKIRIISRMAEVLHKKFENILLEDIKIENAEQLMNHFFIPLCNQLDELFYDPLYRRGSWFGGSHFQYIVAKEIHEFWRTCDELAFNELPFKEKKNALAEILVLIQDLFTRKYSNKIQFPTQLMDIQNEEIVGTKSYREIQEFIHEQLTAALKAMSKEVADKKMDPKVLETTAMAYQFIETYFEKHPPVVGRERKMIQIPNPDTDKKPEDPMFVDIWKAKSDDPSAKPKAIIICLHGWHDYPRSLEWQARLNAKEGIEVWLPHLRGAGHDHSPHTCATKDLLDQFKALFNYLNSRDIPIILAGHSMGCAIIACSINDLDMKNVIQLNLFTPAFTKGVTDMIGEKTPLFHSNMPQIVKEEQEASLLFNKLGGPKNPIGDLGIEAASKVSATMIYYGLMIPGASTLYQGAVTLYSGLTNYWRSAEPPKKIESTPEKWEYEPTYFDSLHGLMKNALTAILAFYEKGKAENKNLPITIIFCGMRDQSVNYHTFEGPLSQTEGIKVITFPESNHGLHISPVYTGCITYNETAKQLNITLQSRKENEMKIAPTNITSIQPPQS